ncbi:MAG: gluconokinase [Pseudomonadota bacterium]
MGVTSTGKSATGAALAETLGGRFVDGDDLHPQSNVDKMARGEPLDDADRAPWLDRVGAALAEGEGTVVIACSALKRAYRDRIRGFAPGAVFVHLHGDRDLIAARMAKREGHFMPVSLLESQLATLEPPGSDEAAVPVDIADPVEVLVPRIVDALEEKAWA